jgi:hypothetical protein
MGDRPVLMSYKSYFDTNPYSGRGIRREIDLTIANRFRGALMIYFDLNNHAAVSTPSESTWI